ncbi:methionyl-tRNA formyltransferase [Acetobacteraceae bacterium]|nr:methionyl-tRNA formyltransferase [Candidatus Parcubacteria bacterium]
MTSNKKPLFAFFGTSLVAVHVLEALEIHGYLPALVVTAPDSKQGRGLVLAPSPARAWALEHGIDVLTPTSLQEESFRSELSNTDWDVFLVASYAKLIPKDILEMPRRGALNVHPSLLPKFRGPSPILSAILENERATGVSIMQMVPVMDAGPIVAQAKVELEEVAWPPRGSVFEELLAKEGGSLLAEVLQPWIAKEITPEVQDESRATYTKKFTSEDARIDLKGDAHTQLLKIRAFDKNPRAYFLTPEGKRVIITEAEIKDAVLELLRVIPEGKKEMSYSDFIRVKNK